ncbi:hypothetical protein GCM10009657_09780 [Oryzihumus leptocrescens]
MPSPSTRHLEFDPQIGVPLEAWLAHRRAEGWVPIRGGIAVVNMASGTVLAFRMRRAYHRVNPSPWIKAEPAAGPDAAPPAPGMTTRVEGGPGRLAHTPTI